MQERRNDSKKTYIYEPGTFKPLAQIQDGTIYHYHVDHLGTPKELTDREGRIVWKARYKTYGNLAIKEVEEVENNLRFQGQYHDAETGLHYNRFRYYHPDTGQFIHQDPIGLSGGMNRYQYAPNPVMWVDPLGLCSGVFRSADGLRQFRIDDRSLLGKRAPGVPHGHLEIYAPGAVRPTTNNHVQFFD